METVDLQVSETTLAELLKRVENGEEVILSRGDKAVAKLVPVEPASPPVEAGGMKGYGSMKGKWNFPDRFFLDPLPEDELALWYGDKSE